MRRLSRGLSFVDAVALGLYPNHLDFHEFGRNAVVNTTMTDISNEEAAGAVYAWPATATTLEILSDSTDDDSDGDGARTVEISGLNSDYDYKTETVTMNGTTPVTTTTVWIRTWKMEVITAGVYADSEVGSNIGTLTLRVAGPGATQLTIDAANQIGGSEAGRITIPRLYKGILEGVTLNVDSSKTAHIFLWEREISADPTAAPFNGRHILLDFDGVAGGPYSIQPNSHLIIPAKTDVWWSAIGGGVNTPVDVDFEILMIPEADLA